MSRKMPPPRRSRSVCILALASVALWFLLCSLASVRAGLPPCVCNNGLVLSDSEVCACQCFQGYLLPRCLYKADDSVELKLMWYGAPVTDGSDACPTDESTTTPPCSQWPDWYDEAALAQTWQDTLVSASDSTEVDTVTVVASRCVTLCARVGWFGHATNATQAAVMATRVAVPGWAAQQVVLSVAQNATAALVPAAFGDALLADVRAATAGPSPVPRYVDEWLRINVGINGTNVSSSSSSLSPVVMRRYWFLSLQEFGWLICALLLFVVLCLIEYCCLFNTERNVGGGVQRPMARATDGPAASGTATARTVDKRAVRTRDAPAASAPRISPARDGLPSREDRSRGVTGLRRRHQTAPSQPRAPEQAQGQGTQGDRGGPDRTPLAMRYPNPLTARGVSPQRGGDEL